MSLTVMMTSAASVLARETQRVALARGRIDRANSERAEKIQKAKQSTLNAVTPALEHYQESGDPFESGASIWDVLKTIRHANGKQSAF